MADSANKIERINGILRSAKECRERLNKLAAALVQLHECEPETTDAAELSRCVTDGHRYETVLQRIINRKLQRIAAEEKEVDAQANV
jgi:hypothetical protein